MNIMTQKQIAEAFSNGKFELTYPYLADNVQWTVFRTKQRTANKIGRN